MRARKITWLEGLLHCAVHGRLTEEQAEEWLEGDDLELALRIVRRRPHLDAKPGAGGIIADASPMGKQPCP